MSIAQMKMASSAQLEIIATEHNFKLKDVATHDTYEATFYVMQGAIVERVGDRVIPNGQQRKRGYKN